MTPGEARNLGARLVEAGVLADCKVEAHRCKGLATTHGASAITGHWTASGYAGSITCDHVARALLGAGRWTADAIRGCRHQPGKAAAKPRRMPVRAAASHDAARSREDQYD